MTDEAIVQKVIKHDEEFKLLSSSLLALADAQKDTNKELHRLTMALGDQKVLIEKISNMDRNMNESFKRVYRTHDALEDRIKELETTRNHQGCPALANMKVGYEADMKDFEEVKTDMKDIKSIPNKILFRMVYSIVGGISIAFLVWVGLK